MRNNNTYRKNSFYRKNQKIELKITWNKIQWKIRLKKVIRLELSRLLASMENIRMKTHFQNKTDEQRVEF